MKVYSITVTPMQEGITKPSPMYPITTMDSVKAEQHFLDACESYGCDRLIDESNGDRSAGGIGYDYRVELICTK